MCYKLYVMYSYCTNVYCCALGERIPLQNITNHLFILKNTILVLRQANYSPSKGVNFPLLSIYDKKKKKKKFKFRYNDEL
jgi:hypothetical protein